MIVRERSAIPLHQEQHAGALVPQDSRDPERRLSLARVAHHLPWLYVVSAFALFAPFFLQGQVLVASTDHWYNHYPNIIFGHRAFRSGDPGLWNPFILAGFDFTTSFHHHMLHPSYWPLLLLPEPWVLHGLTFRVFLEFSGIGLIGFYIFRLYTADRWLAGLFGLVVQLSGYTWFTVTTLNGTHMMLATMAAIYLIVTLHQRRRLASFVLLALCFFDLMMFPHPAYILAFGTVVLVILLAAHGRSVLAPPPRSEFWLAALAAAFGAAMAGVRLVPVANGLINEQVVVASTWLSTVGNVGYFALTAFNPQLLGITYPEALDISAILGSPGRHTQFHSMPYVGLLTALLILIGLRRRFGRPAYLASWGAVAAVGAAYFVVHPLSDVVALLFTPAYHDIMPRTWSAALVVVAFGFCALTLARRRRVDARAVAVALAIVLAVAATGTFALWARVLRDKRSSMPADVWPVLLLTMRVGIVVSVVAAVALLRMQRQASVRMAQWTHAAAGCYALTMVIAVVLGWRLDLMTEQEFVLRHTIYGLGIGLGVMLGLTVVRRLDRGATAASPAVWAAGAAVLILLIAPWPDYPGSRGYESTALSAFLGLGGCILVATAFGEAIVRATSNARLRPHLFLLLGLIALPEMLFVAKVYSRTGAPAFLPLERVYPARQPPRLEPLADVAGGARATDRLKNPEFADEDGRLADWLPGGRDVALTFADVPGIAVENRADDTATVYQDVITDDRPDVVTFGAWVNTTTPLRVRLHLTGVSERGSVGAFSDVHGGNGDWQWLSVSLRAPSLRQVRPHVTITGQGGFAVRSASLVAGDRATPAPMPEARIQVRALTVGGDGEPLDFSLYRASRPDSFLRVFDNNILVSNIAMVYGIPSYAGIDSDIKRHLIDLVRAFGDPGPNVLGRGGIAPALDHPRLLDLLGARYDFQSEDEMAERPGAVPRLAVFRHVETADTMLSRVVDPGFDPASTVVVEAGPASRSIAATGLQRVPLPYRSITFQHLEADVDIPGEAVIVFNDVYSPSWRAELNGNPLPIVRANGAFMAVPVRDAHGTLALRFVPMLFWRFAALSAALMLFLVACGGYVAITSRRLRTELRERVDAGGPS